MSPGFSGKLPRAGDFVARGLPPGFVRRWDRWASRHLVPRLGAAWPAGGLRFHLRAPEGPAMTGVALPSADRAGRPFPLTLAAPAPGPAAPAWYDALAAAGAAALDPAALEAALAAFPDPDAGGPPSAAGLLLWTGRGAPAPADPDAPGPALDALLGLPAETG
jgi:type VI secretion system protein ImpM